MFPGILISFVIFLASSQSSQVVGQLINDEDSSIEPETSPLHINKRDIRNDGAVFLTPYIKSGNLEGARKSSEVTSEHLLYPRIKSYSGFITENDALKSNIFFWYFQIFDDQPVKDNPWIIWLNGGPGVTSMDGLFEEVGPYIVNATNHTLPLKRNEFSWCRNHSVVFIDSPVGTGFSHTSLNRGLPTDAHMYGIHLKVAVQQLVQVFPELKTAPLYIAGEGYGAKYAASLAMELYREYEGTNQTIVELQGIITANGLSDPIMFGKLPQAQYHAGLLTKEDLEKLQPLVLAYLEDIGFERSTAAKAKYDQIVSGCYHLSGQSPFNIHSDRHHSPRFYLNFLNRPDIRAAIHVGETPFVPFNHTVHEKLDYDFLESASSSFQFLLNNGLRVLAYCGMTSMISPCYLQAEGFREWSWIHSNEFFGAKRKYYYYGNTHIGYFKSGGGLTEVMIREAGHYAAMDLPYPIQELVTDWTRDTEYDTDPIAEVVITPFDIA